MQPHRHVRGFTLVEILIALALLGVLASLAYNAFGPAFVFYQRIETTARLKELRAALELAYQNEEILINSGTVAQFGLAAGAISPVVPNPNRVCTSTSTTLTALGRYLSTSAAEAYRDGHGRGLCILISMPLTATVGTSSLKYYAIAIVSAGLDGTVDSTTALSSAGVLTLGGDDKGFLLNGMTLARDRLTATAERMQRVVDAYASYATGRYLANSSRDLSVDYFAATDPAGLASSSWDTSGAVSSTRGASVSMTAIGAHTALGLSTDDVTDAWGQIFRIDNSSTGVRHPSNASTSMRTPPYTARISTTLPGGAEFSLTAMPSF